MARYIKAHADLRGTDPALIDERGKTSWKELNSRVNQLIAAFSANGIHQGDTIAIFAGNCREYFELLTAATHAGIIYVPVNWHFTAKELAYVIDDAGCKQLFIEGQFIEHATQLQNIQCISIRQSMEGPIPGFIDYEHYLGEHSSDEPSVEYLGASMFYTSGTTGKPKGVKTITNGEPVPIEILPMIAEGMTAMLTIQASGTTLLCGPIYHSGQWAFSFPALIIGSTVVIRHKFDPAETLQLIDEHQVTNVHMVPTQFHRLLDLSDSIRHTFSGNSLDAVWHGAAPCGPEVKQQMIDWWGPVINEYYGSTEGSIVAISSTQDWLDKPGTMGKPTPTVEIKIIDDNGNEVAQGDTGDIYVRNLTGSEFEYHNEPEKTQAAHLAPGLFTFGDIGYLDEDGYLFLSDRKIDMIISGGVNIYPAEIETALSTHPAVYDVAVFGIPNKEYGEEVKAAICLMPGHDENETLTNDLIAHCRNLLAGYKAPKSIDYLDVMPRHETGKLYKRLLKDPYWQGSNRKI
ncbi:MAG: AMP-binding protein [Pseudomonadales bacterium]